MARGQGPTDSIIALNRVTGRKLRCLNDRSSCSPEDAFARRRNMATSETSKMVETVTGEAARLREFLSGLDAETWASDSTCEGWTIEDVVAHLAGSQSSRAQPPAGSF